MIRTLGRFLIDEDEHGVRLRVRTSDTFPLIRGLAIAAFASIAFFPLSPLLLFGWCVPGALLLATGNMAGTRGGISRSSYPCIRRLVEVRRRATTDSPFRGGASLEVIVDGASFSGGELLGVVLATSVETRIDRLAGSLRVGRVLRFAPTLVLRDRAFELDIFEAADEADAHELADTFASALAGSGVKTVSVTWAPTQTAFSVVYVVKAFFFIAAWVTASVAAAHLAERAALAFGALGSILVVSVAGAAVQARFGARERSNAAAKLLDGARRALAGAPHRAHRAPHHA